MIEIVGVLLAAAAFAALILVVIWRAVSNVFDWVVETFGNEEAVRRHRRSRGDDA